MVWSAPAGQTIHAVGLRFVCPEASPTVPSVEPRLDLVSAAVLEDCVMTSELGNAKGSLRVGPAAVVHLQNVTLHGPVLMVEGRTTAVQCDLRGAALLGFTLPQVLVQGSLHASACVFTGASSSIQSPGPGLSVLAPGQAYVTDSRIDVGAGLGGTCAIGGTGIVQLARCTTNTPGCGPAAVPTGLGVQRMAAVIGGTSVPIAYRSEPVTPVGVEVSFALDSVSLPFAVQPWNAPLGGSFQVAFGVTDTLGNLTFPFSLPANPAFRGLPIWFHGWSGWNVPLELAPAVGGLLR